jgi:PAS domain S-box-containing protein
MAIDKELLKQLNVLYVEDDEHIRDELSTLLGGFLGKIYTASNGRDGFEVYLKNQDDIDVILSDINMPKLTGIEMIKEIRKFDTKVEVIFATAYSDNEYLSEAIKLRVYDYIIKPIDIKKLLGVFSVLAGVFHQKKLISQQNEELERYKDIIDLNNIVLKTDVDGNITYVNEQFKQIAKYSLEELKGKPLSFLKHKDTPNSIFDEMLLNIKNKQHWQGQIKNISKDGEVFIVDSYMLPVLADSGSLKGTIVVQRDITKEINFKRNLKVSVMKDKGKIFQDSKEQSAVLLAQLNSYKKQNQLLEERVAQLEKEKNELEITFKKDIEENKRLKSEIKTLQSQAETVADKSVTTLRLNKQLADLKHELKLLEESNNDAIEALEKQHHQERVNFNVEIDDLKEEVKKYKSIVDEFGNIEEFQEKLDFWKEKAKDESIKVSKLEQELLKYTDKGILKTILGDELNKSIKSSFGKLLKK